MAAHGLTIMRQMQEMIRKGVSADHLVYHTSGGLSAPGTCFTYGFSTDSWVAVDRVNDRLKRGEATVADLQTVIEQAIQTHMWMDAYPMMEAIQAARHSYVRIGTPYFRKRLEKFEKGDADVHAVARKSIESRYPMEQRAPTFSS